MQLPQIELPSLGRSLSVFMAAPSFAEADTCAADLNIFHQRGGNALHLHGEGGETQSRRAVGAWLRERGLRQEFFLCAQICHDDWNETTQQPINRFTPEAAQQDIAADLRWIGTNFLDLAYLDDRPELRFEPVIEAIGSEIASGRIRSFGVRNFTAERLKAAHAFAMKTIGQGIAAVITTELSLFASRRPLWPEYVPFDAALRQTIADLGLSVLAHAGDLTLGQCVFGDEDPLARLHPEWVERWQRPENMEMAARIQEVAAAQESEPRAIQMAWLLKQPFPVIAILSLPAFPNRDRQAVRARRANLAGGRGISQGVLDRCRFAEIGRERVFVQRRFFKRRDKV